MSKFFFVFHPPLIFSPNYSHWQNGKKKLGWEGKEGEESRSAKLEKNVKNAAFFNKLNNSV